MRRVLCALIVLSAFSSAQTSPSLRLPEGVKPSRYSLDLRLVPEEDTFAGTVDIEIEIAKATGTIWLNASGLKIESASVNAGGKTETARVLEGSTQFIGLATANPVGPGKATLSVRYTGNLNKRDVEGAFKQQEGSDQYILTQFEPTSARRAFPSFDEPMFKTPFTLTLHVPKQHKAFANTPLVSETDEPNGMKAVKFAESKPLPTYLVAFAVGPFDIVEGGPVGRRKFQHRVIVPRGRSEDAKYVVGVTPKIVAALEDYFGIPYPYEKLDQITIPITVGFGAMENAGLITYQQGILLAKPGQDTPNWKRGAVEVITHEVAHQWFGNMVTPSWWDDIWLNEAFATWMEDRIIDSLFPEWNIRVSSVVSKHAVMGQDSLVTARKIRQPIEEQGDIGRAFDGITYQKGGAVIRMFENYVGPELFRRGVQNYMKKHAWGNATAVDFLRAISDASKKDVQAAFSTFLDRTGVPLLNVSLSCQPDGKPQLEIQQQRSLPLGSKGDRNVYWQVPVCVTYDKGQAVARQCSVVADPKDKITLQDAAGCPAWVYVGEGATGYYRVRYADDLQKKLAASTSKLKLTEQVDLLRNTWALVTSGQLSADVALAMVPAAAKAPEREIVLTATQIINGLERDVPVELREKYAAFARENFSERARSLGWTPKSGESDDVRLLRPVLLRIATRIGKDQALIDEGKKLAATWLKQRSGLSTELIVPALQTAARYGDRQLFEEYVAAIRATKDRTERGYIQAGLAGFADRAIAADAVKLLLDPALDVRELSFLLNAYQGEPETERVAWDLVKANYNALLARMPSRLGAGGGIALMNAGAFFCSTEGYAELKSFFEGKVENITAGQRRLDSLLEQIEVCVPRRAANVNGITKFFPAQ